MKEGDLQDNVPARVDVDGVPVLMYRSGNEVYAMCAVCAHEGGPLQKGEIHQSHVTCPWHQSVYDMRDGHVVHGPSTYPEPVYQVRRTDGNFEIEG